MRISTNMIYEAGVARMNEQQSALLKTQQQIAANRRLLTPADDPIAAARALDLSQGKSINEQYATNRQNAKNTLSQEENVLSSLTSLIQDLQTQTVTAGNGSYDNEQRKYIATDLRSRFEELVGLANSRDGEGNYMFSGYQTATQPFALSAANPADVVQYSGDQGQRMLQVGTARQLAVSDTGDAVLGNIPRYQTFEITKPAGVTVGAAVVDAASLAPAPDTYSYQIAFDVTAIPPTYTVSTTPPAAPATVMTGNYVSGEAIKFKGLQVVVSGVAANTDTVTISTAPPGNQSLFKTLKDMITLLETPADGLAAKTNLTHGLEKASGNLANALDNVLKIRASVGSRLKEIDTLDVAGEDRDLQYADSISKLTDLDYVKAISDLVKQQTVLEAAQKAFVKTSGLSLFNLL